MRAARAFSQSMIALDKALHARGRPRCGLAVGGEQRPKTRAEWYSIEQVGIGGPHGRGVGGRNA